MLTIPLLLGISLPTVAIDLPPDTPEATVVRVVESCNQALGGPRCQAATGAPNATTLVAIVRWEGNELRISLRKGDVNGEEVEHRQVAFAVEDAPRDRFIAAGLMVAALTAAQTNLPAKPAEAASPPEEPETPKVNTEPKTQEPPQEPRQREEPKTPAGVTPSQHLAIGVAGAVGQGMQGEPPKWGGALRASWIMHQPRIGVSAQASHLVANEPTQLSWSSVSAGLIGRLTPWGSFFSMELSAEGVAEQVMAEANQAGQQDSAKLWRMGGQATVFASLTTGIWAEPFLGLQLTLLERGFEVTLSGERLATEPKLRALAQLGLRLLLF